MSRLRTTGAVFALGIALLGLTACSVQADVPTSDSDQNSTSAPTQTVGPVGTFGHPDLSGSAPKYHLTYKQDMPDGSKVICVYSGGDTGGSSTCDFNHPVAE